jgi:hypothetical protein
VLRRGVFATIFRKVMHADNLKARCPSAIALLLILPR